MKKTILAFAFIICVSVLLSRAANALIQSSPKYEKVELTVQKTDVSPVADGIISENEYAKLDISENMLSYVVGSEADWTRVKKTSFNAYAAVCEGKFWFAIEYRIEPEFRKIDCKPKNMWAQSCLLMSFAEKGATGRSALELGIRDDDRYVWRYIDGKNVPVTEYAAVYNDGVYTYEFSINLSSFCSEDDKEFLFCFSVSVGDYYDNGRYAYVQLGKGISGFSTAENAEAGKDASLFPIFTVTERQIIETETEESETEPEMPPASDDRMLIITALIAAGCIFTVVFTVKYGKKLII